MLERLLGRPAVKEYLPLQAGDVPETLRRLTAGGGDRLCADHADRGRARAFHRVVPRVLPRAMIIFAALNTERA